MKLPKLPKLVEVVWGDAWGSSGWRAVDKHECSPTLVRSIGYLLHENKDGYLLASGVNFDGDMRDALQVNFKPRGMVKSVRVIRK